VKYIAALAAMIFLAACQQHQPAEKYVVKGNDFYLVKAMRDSLDANGRLWNIVDLEYAKDKSHKAATLTGNPYPGDTVLMGTNTEGSYTVVIHQKH
jgi:hypothetical protein